MADVGDACRCWGEALAGKRKLNSRGGVTPILTFSPLRLPPLAKFQIKYLTKTNVLLSLLYYEFKMEKQNIWEFTEVQVFHINVMGTLISHIPY